MSRLRPPDVGDRRHDPASLQAAAADLVLGGAPVGNPLQRYVGTAAVGPAWRHLQADINHPDRNNVVAGGGQGMLRLGRRSDEVRRCPAPDSAIADPQEIIADLRRELTACSAELAQRTVE